MEIFEVMKKYVRYDDRPNFVNRPREKSYGPPVDGTNYEMSVWLFNSFNGCKVSRREGESTDNMLRRFKKVVEQAGLKKREFYLSPSQKKREKKKKALKRMRKAMKLESDSDFDPKMVFKAPQDANFTPRGHGGGGSR